MIIDNYDLKYISCFPIKGDEVLLIQTVKRAWHMRWNILGGKPEKDESPLQAVKRELFEETQIKQDEQKFRFAGVVTWDHNADNPEDTDNLIGGMFVFMTEISDRQFTKELPTREGLIAWKKISWASNKKNKEVAGNVPYYLPRMIESKEPLLYHCVFKNDELIDVTVSLLPKNLLKYVGF